MSPLGRWKRTDTVGGQSADSGFAGPQFDALVKHLHARLVRETDIGDLLELPRPALQQHLANHVSFMASEEGYRLTDAERTRLLEAVTSELIGYGPLDPLLHDDSINEVMVNGPDEVYIDRNGVIERCTTVGFRDQDHIRDVIDRIVFPLGRHVDDSSPMVDARLPDGSRVNAIIPPLALNGPLLTIRRFKAQPWTADDLVRVQTWTPEMAQFMAACARARLNTLISGGSGAGKTSTLNVLAGFIHPSERIVTIEEAAELRFWQTHPHVLRLEARPPNLEGQGEITVRDLVRNALHMRPERIIIGEVRGPEALDMLQAMNTGHEGSLTTVHANTPHDAFSRLETMVMWAGVPLTSQAIREQLIGVLNIVIQQARMPGGARKIVAISEIQERTGGDLGLKDIFVYRQTGVGLDGVVQGYFEATGVVPLCLERMATYGIHLPTALFEPRNLSNGQPRTVSRPADLGEVAGV